MSHQLQSIGPYELRGELGRGAMAQVWRAWDPNLAREVAIKVPLFDTRLPEDTLEEMGRRFVAEGRAAARLSHPGIVAVFAANVWDGTPAIVMELVEGTTLSNLIAAGPLSPSSVLNILDQLLDAVGYAHAHGVIHRDIKPDNIFVTVEGQVKLADFGIARIDDGSITHATLAGTVLGTPGYMSPEQARGTTVDGRSDLFSIAIIAHEMLTGTNPFGAGMGTDTTTLIYRIVHEPAPELPASVAEDLPADMRPAIMAALSKDPACRPASAEDFRRMLHGLPTAITGPGYGDVTAPLGSTGSFDRSLNEATRQMPTYGTAPVVDRGAPGSDGGPHRTVPAWAPYALIAGVCTLALAIALASALGGRGGGGGSPEYSTYLGLYDDRVAIYTSSSTEPYRVTDVAVGDLSPEDAAELGGGKPVASIAEAENLVLQYQEAAEASSASSSAQGSSSVSTQQTPEEEDEEETREADDGIEEVKLTVKGADGTTRTETIRRDAATQRVIPDSNTRRLAQSEVDALTDAERCIAWNEIIAASNGYAFKNSGLASYFAGCSWYSRNTSASSNGNLSADASQNVAMLQDATGSWWKRLAAN